MNKVYACIDGLTNSSAVIEGAAWSAQRLEVPLELLHVLERNEAASRTGDYSGAIGWDAQETLLQELSELDEQRGKIAQEVARRMLQAAAVRATQAGVSQVDTRLRSGELIESVLDMEPDARLFVLGEHYHAERPTKIHVDHHVERVIRSVKRPVLVVPGPTFAAPQGFVLAFDGSETAHKVVKTVAASPFLKGLPALIAMACTDAQAAQPALLDAQRTLEAAGFTAATQALVGEPEQVIPALLKTLGHSLLVMGAYGHSRIRQFIVGSTTTTLLRLSESPVLVLR